MDTHAERFRRHGLGRRRLADVRLAEGTCGAADERSTIDREDRFDQRLQGRSRCGSGSATW